MKQHKPRQLLLTRINPLAKIVISLVLTGIAFSLKSLAASGLLVGVLIILLFASTRIQLKTVLIAAVSIAAFIAIALLLSNSIQSALLYALRLLAILLPAPLLSITTPASDLVRALQAIKLPSFLVLSLMLTWRFFPIIDQEAHRILEANQLRGVDLSRQPQQWFSALFVPLIFRIVSYADEVSIGLETRGYNPNAPRSLSRSLTWSIADTLFVGLSGLILTIVALLN